MPGFAFLEEQFDFHFRGLISWTFYTIGLDHYSKYTKISLFIILFLIPIFVFLVVFGVEKLLDLVDPTP
jgi:hypothetical protein